MPLKAIAAVAAAGPAVEAGDLGLEGVAAFQEVRAREVQAEGRRVAAAA